MTERARQAYGWVLEPRTGESSDHVCVTHDVFRVRLDRFYRELLRSAWPEADGALTGAIVGEIGNNCFDHNLGQWRDIPGCWFDYGIDSRATWVVIADRGQGVLSSLQQAVPSLQTDQEALEIAFSKVVSGRSPEKRGNGLKFVRQVVNDHPGRGLLFLSGKGEMSLGGLSAKAEVFLASSSGGNKPVHGTLALILEEIA